ncbi:hypothetical protein EMIT0347P_10188 [Pseudomonas sp. IT-347P]
MLDVELWVISLKDSKTRSIHEQFKLSNQAIESTRAAFESGTIYHRFVITKLVRVMYCFLCQVTEALIIKIALYC